MPENTKVRKQLYITREQEHALKERAREEGLTEAEIVREALDRHLRPGSDPVIPVHRRQALEELHTLWGKIARHHQLPTDFRFDREQLYAEREYRWRNTSEK